MLARGMYALIEQFRVLGGVGASLLRRILRRRRNVIAALTVIVLGSMVWLLALSVGSIRQAAELEAAAQQQSTAAPLLRVEAEPVAGAAGSASADPEEPAANAAANAAGEPTPVATASSGTLSSAPSGSVKVGDGPQAVEPGETLEAAAPVVIPTPTKPEADSAKPEPVATAWAEAYFSRPDGTWEEWATWAEPWVAPELLAYMATDEFNERGALDGKQPSQVIDVRFSPADGSTGRDTPVRWSRTLDIDVQTEDGRVTTVTYIIEENLTQSGWQIVNAEKKSWTVK